MLKKYDCIVKNYGIVINKSSGTSGHIDYIGENYYGKRQGNSFIVYNNKSIGYDFPVPYYVDKFLKEVYNVIQ